MLRTTICLLSISLIWTSPSPQDLELRNIGGDEARPEQFPWQAELLIKVHYILGEILELRCGGSIINQEWILTAAHCLSKNAVSIQVLTGTIDLRDRTDPKNIIEAERWEVHEDIPGFYDMVYGIGVVKLSRPLIFNENTQAIRLSSQKLSENVPVTVSGWGLTHNGNFSFSYPTTLHYADLVTISDETCNGIGIQTDDVFCAVSNSSKLKSACSINSGSPVVVYKNASYTEQVGIVSFRDNFSCGVINSFIRISSFVDWIKNKTMV